MQYNHTVTSISINKGEEKMITKKQEMNLLVIGSDDDKNTYAVLREWKEGEGKALVIEIYPTLSPSEQYIKNDLSSFHLMNHVSEQQDLLRFVKWKVKNYLKYLGYEK